MSRITAVLALACLASLLAACGGGGGGVRPSMDQPSLDRADAQTAAPEGALASAQEAATSLPRFGSVTQSQSRNVSGISTDAASAAFDGQRLTVQITREDASTLTLDTARDTEIIIDSGTNSITGRPFRDWGLLNVTGSGATLARVAADWRESDTTDWLAGGYWLHFSGDVLSGNIAGVEAGAFVDGPELSGTPNNLPTTGTASYQGLAAGLYAGRYGTDAQDITPGSHEIGEYEGDLTLTADFANANVSGRIDNISVSGYSVDAGSGRVESFTDFAIDYQVNLGQEDIDSDGTFRGDGVTVTSPTTTFASSSGSWGGKFSTINDSAGNPRLVAGTHGGNLATSGGSTASFVGAFYGVSEEFDANQ